jgi:predicted ribosome-associated RNA-binding protein Tma20
VVDIQIVAASVGSGSVEAVLAGMRILAQGIVSYCFSVHKDEVEMFNMVGHSF